MLPLLWICSVLVVATYLTGPLIDPDLWWHLTVGRWILHHSEIPSVELWNRFALGKPWVAYSWSNEVLFAAVDGFYGIHGLLVLKLCLLVGLGFSLAYCFSVLAKDRYFGVLLAALTLAGCSAHATLRPQTITWIYLSWLILACHRIETKGIRPRYLVQVALLLMLWANTHITTAIALGVVGGWTISGMQISRAVKVVSVGFLGTLLTPYLGWEWIIFLSKTGHPLEYQAIAEFQPATILFYPTGFLSIVATFLGFFEFQRPGFLSKEKLLVAFILVLASLAIVKFMPIAVIVIAALVAEQWGSSTDRIADYGNIAEGIERLKRLIFRLPKEGLAFVLLCMVVVNVVKLWRGPVDITFLPKQAVDFMLEKKLPHPFANDFGHGGTLCTAWQNPMAPCSFLWQLMGGRT